MTRKRFIKLLMSHGISRNEAVKKAAEYNSRNLPYKLAYLKEISNKLPLSFMNLSRAVTAASVAVKRFNDALNKVVENAVNRIGRSAKNGN